MVADQVETRLEIKIKPWPSVQLSGLTQRAVTQILERWVSECTTGVMLAAGAGRIAIYTDSSTVAKAIADDVADMKLPLVNLETEMHPYRQWIKERR